ncbi:predicted protein [Plenodomus lingam JN3]|uniref:Predicted protein n=1 Tax=Leptosphaeria maculans (strain JN3 / isolate v23.1.3 / race Av1-4-5-6-7-8) TaxID=985895 RepID=E4ZNT3_LEPMJ|nr:predicted protein [Plenodomus lingam JN3]CBX93302.1 predicted protein [Plenodomus lingam JN3]
MTTSETDAPPRSAGAEGVVLTQKTDHHICHFVVGKQ